MHQHPSTGRPAITCPEVTCYPDGTLVGTRGHVLRTLPWDGYLTVTRRIAGRPRPIGVHILVCEAFHGPKPSPLHQVRHLNGDPTDCSAGNLAWGTAVQNAADRDAHGTTPRGELHGLSKLTAAQVLEIRQLAAEGVHQRAIAADYGISQPQVSSIHRRKVWTWLADEGEAAA